MKIFHAAILPKGYLAGGIACGIKKSGKKDLALIYSKAPATAAAMFTTNKLKAAPVLISEKHIKANQIRAIIANSGNANCSTGKPGLSDAVLMASLTSEALGLEKKESVLVASTGIIGQRLQVGKIKSSIKTLTARLNDKGLLDAARAIMTTDTTPKFSCVSIDMSGKRVLISSIAKGAGMIAPNMATMLAFIVTDAKLPKVFMNSSLLEAVEGSFNSITIDGCMSTNDTVFLMANGQAKNDNPTKADLVKFKEALNYVCLDLAKKIVQDAEGATKFVEINISGARNKTEAKKLAFGIANSALLKTAIFGENENWGRIAAAAGSAGVKINPDKMKIKFTPFKNNSIKIDVNLNQGKSGARVYTSDLSLKYVRINAGYN